MMGKQEGGILHNFWQIWSKIVMLGGVKKVRAARIRICQGFLLRNGKRLF